MFNWLKKRWKMALGIVTAIVAVVFVWEALPALLSLKLAESAVATSLVFTGGGLLYSDATQIEREGEARLKRAVDEAKTEAAQALAGERTADANAGAANQENELLARELIELRQKNHELKEELGSAAENLDEADQTIDQLRAENERLMHEVEVLRRQQREFDELNAARSNPEMLFQERANVVGEVVSANLFVQHSINAESARGVSLSGNRSALLNTGSASQHAANDSEVDDDASSTSSVDYGAFLKNA